MQQAPGHRVYDRPPSCLYPPTQFSCPNADCIASTYLHNALRNQQQAMLQQGRANLNYVPFHEIKANCKDVGDEACHLAVFDQDYPPRHARSARVGPEWLKYKEWRKVIEMRARGKNILEIAAAVDKNASLLRVYVDTYLNTNTHVLGPLPSASSTDSQSTADTISTGSDELFPLYDEVMIPVSGAPDPSFLSRSEQELVWKMFQRNETVRSMSVQLKKGRRKISQYINAYMRPRLLKLQEEELECEAEFRLAGTSTQVTPLTDHSPRPRTPETARTAAFTGSLSRLRQEQSLHSISGMELELVGPLLISPTLNIPNESHKDSSGSNALATPKSATANSLFGDSPVDGTEGSPITGIVSTRQKEDQPTSRKRKLDDGDVAGEPQQAPKRLRHLSLP